MLVKDKTAESFHLRVADEDGLGKDDPIAEGHVTVEHLLAGAGEGKVTYKNKDAGKVSWAACNWEPLALEEVEKRIADKVGQTTAAATNQNKKKNKKGKK